MATNFLSDGNTSWIGGMDTSRNPSNIGDVQYSKACNVIVPDALGGLRSRFGMHCCQLSFDSKKTRDIYTGGNVQGAGHFTAGGQLYLVCVVDGYVLKFTRIRYNAFFVENLNANNPNNNIISDAWVITLPNACVVNNGFNHPLYITATACRRTIPRKSEIGIGRMGVYLQNRLFYVDQSGKKIIASDAFNPIKITREGTNIEGFMCPDAEEVITAIGRQKSILGTVEGGNLIWSSNKDLYSADVRGTRSEWGNLESRVGKATETIPGYSAASSHSFESFNTNMYFRSSQFGICDIKQSEYQFGNLDSTNNQSIEASFYLNNDTPWMLDKCYTRSCNRRLYTTVAPEQNEDGFIYWNGILCMYPSAAFSNVGVVPKRFESVFTGVRPWALTVTNDSKDEMFIHSFDKDGHTRLYVMNEDSDYDLNANGNVIEIQGFFETRTYSFSNPLLPKQIHSRFYSLGTLERSTKIKLFSRASSLGAWSEMWSTEHLICRTRVENGKLIPETHKPQTRSRVNVSEEKFDECDQAGKSVLGIQYRIEFSGPINFDTIAAVAALSDFDKTIHQDETECHTLVYSDRPTFSYSISSPQL